VNLYGTESSTKRSSSDTCLMTLRSCTGVSDQRERERQTDGNTP
jgi:hypothetical protein